MNNRELQVVSARLSNALNHDYDILDMDAVLSVITTLERTTITKEQLETTRLAKYINHLRRRTQSDDLARRSKSLLKRWREMVGIRPVHDAVQNPISESQTITIVDNFPHLGHSQPASPAVVSSAENFKSSATSIEIVHSSLGSNSTTGKLGSHSKKPMVVSENVESPQVSSRPSGRLSTTKPPTSFSNLIPGFSSGNPQYFDPNISHRNLVNPHCTTRDGDSLTVSNVSNSNSEIKYNHVSIDTAPIIIDIPDSSSGSNLIISPAPTIAEPIAMLSSSSEVFGTQFKHKKNKKDKKRKDEKITKASSQSQFFKQHSEITTESKKNAQPLEDKYKSSNISEILSLSNSSMSSIFPNDDALKLFSQQKSDKHIPPTKTHCTNELSFAGKFNKNYSQPNSRNTNEDVANSSIYASSSEAITNVGYTDKIRKTPANSIKFSSGNDINMNSNDSASNYPAVQVCLNEQSPRNQSERSKFDAGVNYLQNRIVDTKTSVQQPISGCGDYDNTALNADKKVPKKRGRKKGSRGVDSVIAKETSLSSQMLITSLGGCGKKVKTTKELYAEMQNRKLGIVAATSSPTLMFSRPASSCSEPSLQSPQTSDGFNAALLANETTSILDENKSNGVADDDSETITSEEPSRDSTSIHKKKIWLGNAKTDENNVSALSNASVDKQLLELMDNMPTKPSLSDVEIECLKETYPCTCKIIEVLATPSDNTQQEDSLSTNDLLDNTVTPNPECSVPIKAEETPKISEPSEDKEISSSLSKPKKSIFDLDFDEDDDPLLTIFAETAPPIKEEPIVKNIDADTAVNTEVVISGYPNVDDAANQLVMQDDISDSQSNLPLPEWPVYTIEEDPDCIAKDRFHVQTQKITNFHINALHNCYILNINGNWDDSDRNDANSTANNSNEVDMENLMENIVVVPKYGSLLSDYIQKDLSHIAFRKNFVIKQSIVKCVDDSALFLGVSRYLNTTEPDEMPNCKEYNTGKDLVEKKLNIEIPIQMCRNNDADQNHINNNYEKDRDSCLSNAENSNSCTSPTGVPADVTDHSLVNSSSKNADDLDTAATFNEHNRDTSPSSSGGSLKQIQQSINLKLKNQKIQQKDCDTNVKRRKRKRKKFLKDLRNCESNKLKRSKRVSFDSNANSSDGEQAEDPPSGADMEDSAEPNNSTSTSGGNVQIDNARYDGEHDFCDYHEVVTRDLSIPSTGSNHIVLTFKKTNKTYSSASVLPTKPPIRTSEDHTIDAVKVSDAKLIIDSKSAINDDNETRENNRKSSVGNSEQQNTIANELRHIKQSSISRSAVLNNLHVSPSSIANGTLSKQEGKIITKSKKPKGKRASRRLEDELFFHHEIFSVSNRFDVNTLNTSNSSSCSDLSDFSDCATEMSAVSNTLSSLNEASGVDASPIGKIKTEKDELSDTDAQQTNIQDNDNERNMESATYPIELSEENNGLLVSFNNIYEANGNGNGDQHTPERRTADVDVTNLHATTQGILQDHTAQLKEMLPNKNCDDFNTLYLNNNNFNLIKYNNSKVPSLDFRADCKNLCNKKFSPISNQLVDEVSMATTRTPELVPHKEFRTGLRAVDEDVHDEDGNNCSRIQQFKEWHQVLQLRSYNDELLTVMPYVVLE